MTIGLSLLATAVGAILKVAVNVSLVGLDIGAVGVILMIVGALGLAIGLGLFAAGESEDLSA